MHCMVSRVNKKPLYAGREFKYIHPWRINADHKEIVSHIFQSLLTLEKKNGPCHPRPRRLWSPI